jgi:hypothetical protein
MDQASRQGPEAVVALAQPSSKTGQASQAVPSTTTPSGEVDTAALLAQTTEPMVRAILSSMDRLQSQLLTEKKAKEVRASQLELIRNSLPAVQQYLEAIRASLASLVPVPVATLVKAAPAAVPPSAGQEASPSTKKTG